jgi:LPS biosynthesis protein
MFDKYPEIRDRFTIPQDIYGFKRYAADDGHEWLLHKRPMTDNDVKGVSIQILHAVDEFCKINNIKYSLAYGTLIGAVRHKGFIPWDDDVDIMMLRPDYEKFIRLFNNFRPDLYSVVSCELEAEFHWPMAKIVCNTTIKDELGYRYKQYGFAIDLFPIDIVPSSKRN